MGLAPQQIRAQLRKILASPLFAGAQRLSRFLEYLVEENLAHPEQPVKEYSIGVDVFERGDSFNPSASSVVRVHAARLRSKLLEYYTAEGRDDPIAIDIPKGRYTPVFTARSSSGAQPADAAAPAATSTRKALLAGAVCGVAFMGVLLALSFGRIPKPPAELISRELTVNSPDVVVTTAAISPNGELLAYADQFGVHVENVATAERWNVQPPGLTAAARISWLPDGRRFLVSGIARPGEPQAAWIASASGADSRMLLPDAADASVSPDGTHLAFVRNGSAELWIGGANGEMPRRIATARPEERFTHPWWSPDSRRVWYNDCGSAAAGYAIRLTSVTPDGGNKVVAFAKIDLTGGIVLPDGSLIYSEAGSPARLWKMPVSLASGRSLGPPQRITEWASAGIPFFSATADGKALVFVAASSAVNVYVAELSDDGDSLGAVRALTHEQRAHYPHAWTPDGKSVIYESARTGVWQVLRQSPGQDTGTPIVPGPDNQVLPQVSPDGKWLLYAVLPPGGYLSPGSAGVLKRVPLSGGVPQQVLPERGYQQFRCAHTPACFCVVDERRDNQIVFRELDPLRGKGKELAHVDLDAPFAFDWDLAPDGSAIAFVPAHRETGRIEILPLDGTARRTVTVSGWAHLSAITWDTRGRGWYAQSQTGETSTLLHVDPGGRAHVLHQKFRGFPAWGVPSPDGRWLAFADNGGTSKVWMIRNF